MRKESVEYFIQKVNETRINVFFGNPSALRSSRR
ncbi:hypothetical protein DRN98_02855 [Methanosarcinales archaeon]|nr:MAG: hypothetical protein DRN98_02855 [Methanosarcinales archaeon]